MRGMNPEAGEPPAGIYRRHLESRGQRFSLRDFHDRFLRLGLPVSLAREVMIPGDTGSSL